MTINGAGGSKWRLFLSAVAAAALMGVVLAGTLGAASPDQAAVEAVAKAAVGAEYALFTVPDARVAVGPAKITRMSARARDVLGSLYAEPLRSQRISAYQAGIDQLGAGSAGANSAVQTDGGATAFSNWKVSIGGTTANVSVRARVFIEDTPSTAAATPSRIESELDYKFTMLKDSGRWLISTVSSDYVPGFEP